MVHSQAKGPQITLYTLYTHWWLQAFKSSTCDIHMTDTKSIKITLLRYPVHKQHLTNTHTHWYTHNSLLNDSFHVSFIKTKNIGSTPKYQIQTIFTVPMFLLTFYIKSWLLWNAKDVRPEVSCACHKIHCSLFILHKQDVLLHVINTYFNLYSTDVMCESITQLRENMENIYWIIMHVVSFKSMLKKKNIFKYDLFQMIINIREN